MVLLGKERPTMTQKPKYGDEFKKQIIKLHLEDGRTLIALEKEYKVSKATISNWVKRYREECQINEEANSEKDLMERNRELKKQLEELKKENAFLKKAAAFFAKEID